jgi:hypothetical protein
MERYVALLILALSLFSVADAAAYEIIPRISLSLSEEYNDNVFLTRDRVSDFITRISPGINLALRSLNSEITLDYFPTFNFYAKNSDLNNTGQTFSGNGSFTLSDQLSVGVTESYIKSTDITDLRGIPDLGPLAGRTEERLNILGGTITYKLRSNLISTADFTYTNVTYKEPLFSDLRSYAGSIGLTYIQSERDSFSASARYTKFDFETGSDSTVQDYTLGVTHRFTPTFSVRAEGGVSLTKVQDTSGTGVDYSGGVDLTKQLSQGTAILSYRQSVTAGSRLVNGEPLRTQTVSLRFTRPFANSLTGTVTTEYVKYKSIETSNVSIDTISFGASLSYRISRMVDMALSYYYLNYNDKMTSSNDYFNNVVLLTLRISYSRQ